MPTDQELFEDLFILDMANSHEGNLEHGLRVIDEAAAVVKKHGVKATVKFQYRDLDTIIHPDFKDRQDVKHIPRFLSNRLSWDAFKQMNDRVREHGMVTVVTPSDENSVDVCVEHDIDILKVPSPAAQDWPLLEKIASTGKPVIVSTGGLTLNQIDETVDFFRKKNVQFAIEHCVSVYPMENEQAHMNFLRRLIKRYPDLVVGWSGHEAPENTLVGVVAVGAGARMQERHIGIPTDEKPLNAYSMNPQQIDVWIGEIKKAQAVMGSSGDKVMQDAEQEALKSLARGVWAKQNIKNGEAITKENTFYAMPVQEGQLTSGKHGELGAETVATKDYAANEMVHMDDKKSPADPVKSIIRDIKGMLKEAGLEVGSQVEFELSHHYGIEKYAETGAAIVNVLNREYCKKLLVMLPGQTHPDHMHKQKEEAFHMLWGELTLIKDGVEQHLKAGDVVIIERGSWHQFKTEKGAILEEVSTTHVRGDSFYKDPVIANQEPMARKTIVKE